MPINICSTGMCSDSQQQPSSLSSTGRGRSVSPPRARCTRPRAGRGQRPAHSAFPRVPRAPACAELLKRHLHSPRRHAVVKAICQSLTRFQVVSVSCTLVFPLFLQTPLAMNHLFYCLCSCPPLLVSATELLLSRRPIGLAYTLIQTWLFPSDF